MVLSQHKITLLKNSLLQLAQSKQFKKAEKLYLKHKDSSIPDAEIWNLFAGVNSERNNFNDVANCCKKIIQLSPENIHAYYNCGLAYQHLNDPDKAIEMYNACIKQDPGFVNAYANCASIHQHSRNYDEAIEYYSKALSISENADIRTYLGRTYAEKGETDSAIQNYTIALNRSPDNKRTLFYMAQLLFENQKYDESSKYYIQLLELDKEDTRVLNNLGRLYDETNNVDKAINCYKKAIEINNSQATTHSNLGKTLRKCGDLENAEKSFNKSLELDGTNPETFFNLGKIYSETDRKDKAIEFLKKSVDMEYPVNYEKAEELLKAAKYFLKSLLDPEAFDADKKSFVADLFDEYADKFDDHLVKGLEYKTPEKIKHLFDKHRANKTSFNAILDLGCGTGLCGPFLKNYTSHLTGIDLSKKMIDKARETSFYDELVVGEITEHVNQSDQVYDAIIAADVFVYVGGLNDIFKACSSKISREGIFIFSTELLPDSHNDAYKLFDSGRYKHTTDYIDVTAKSHGFSVIDTMNCVLRKEHGSNVDGTISVLIKD